MLQSSLYTLSRTDRTDLWKWKNSFWTNIKHYKSVTIIKMMVWYCNLRHFIMEIWKMPLWQKNLARVFDRRQRGGTWLDRKDDCILNNLMMECYVALCQPLCQGLCHCILRLSLPSPVDLFSTQHNPFPYSRYNICRQF